MKNLVCVVFMISLIAGCSSSNGAYKDFLKSPCACLEMEKKTDV